MFVTPDMKSGFKYFDGTLTGICYIILADMEYLKVMVILENEKELNIY